MVCGNLLNIKTMTTKCPNCGQILYPMELHICEEEDIESEYKGEEEYPDPETVITHEQ